MNLFLQLLTGAGMIGVTVIIQAMALDFIIRRTGASEKLLRRLSRNFWQPLMASIVVVSVFAVQITHIWLWAILYRVLGCAPLENFSDALYFATTTYTTLGYGDIVLEPSFRMLSGVEAANGFLLFGWTTAFIFEVISQLYKREAKSI